MFEMGLDQDWVRVEGLMGELSGLQTEINRLQARQVEIVAELDPVLLRDLTGSRTIRDWLTAQLDVSSPTALKLRQTDPNHSGFGKLFQTGEIGLDRAYLLTKLDQTGLTPTELDSRATTIPSVGSMSSGNGAAESTRSRARKDFDDRYLVIQPSLDSSAHRFWGQAVGTDSEAILRAISQRETELPVLEDETKGHRQLDALASICLDSLTGGETGRDVTVAEVVIDGLPGGSHHG